MSLKQLTWMVLLTAAFLITGCGMHYTVDGRVIDAATQRPVEGAVVAIEWIRYKVLSPPGLPRDWEDYGTTEQLTDKEGHFSIPKYPFGEYEMGVYKSEYVCWSSDTVFNPEGEFWEEMFRKRPQPKLTSGMVVELQPVTVNEYSDEHASFAVNVSTGLGSSPLFDNAIGRLRTVESERGRKEREEMLKQKKLKLKQLREQGK